MNQLYIKKNKGMALIKYKKLIDNVYSLNVTKP